MTGLRILLCLSLLLCGRALLPGAARARDAVLLLERPGLRPELCAALRVQLSDVADVLCRLEPAENELALRIAQASREVERQSLRLAVLLERDPSVTRVRMILVGAAPDQAVLAIESVDDRPAPDVDRSLALKVRDTVELLASEPAPASRPALLRVLTREPPRPESVRLVFEAGAAMSVGRHTRGAGVLALGGQLQRGAAYVELALDARLLAAQRANSELGTVYERAWGLTLGLRAGRRAGPLLLGALAEAGWVRSHAVGVTRDGSSGEQTLGIARLGVGLDLRLVLLDGPASVALRLAPTLQVDPLAQHYELDRQRVLSLGRVHAWVPLSLTFALPLRRLAGGDDV